jgi:hypothetical protein
MNEDPNDCHIILLDAFKERMEFPDLKARALEMYKEWEPDAFIIEAKAETYFTTGTAGEKILGCPFKYAEIPVLYNKPLKIICIGGAEKECREEYGNLSDLKCTPQKKKFLDFFRENGIEYIGATDIMNKLSS